MKDDQKPRGMTIVVFSGELDRVLAAFNLANTGAAMGMEVTLFFTFWGLNVVRKRKSGAAAETLAQRMMNKINRGGAARLKLSKMNMLGAGTFMIKRLMRRYNIEQLDEMITTAASLGVKFVACTTSMALMGLAEDDFAPQVTEFAGAATYLAKAEDSEINLFI
ncbi:MAG: DsrE/DsrF/DrsH-like family protein [Candidatus Geothermincolia bacterium]